MKPLRIKSTEASIGSGSSTQPMPRSNSGGSAGSPLTLTQQSLDAFKTLQLSQRETPLTMTATTNLDVLRPNSNSNRAIKPPHHLPDSVDPRPPASAGGGPSPSPTPPPTRTARRSNSVKNETPTAIPSTSVSPRESKRAKGKSQSIHFASFLDDAPVEACLEYLTRPHSSWDSASRTMQQRLDRIEEHNASVFVRSLTMSRRSSFASSYGGEASSAWMDSSITSVATAPAGFPRTYQNGSKTLTGTLRRGRLVGSSSNSFAAEGGGMSMRLDSGMSVPAGGGAGNWMTSARKTGVESDATPDLSIGGNHLTFTGSSTPIPETSTAAAVRAGSPSTPFTTSDQSLRSPLLRQQSISSVKKPTTAPTVAPAAARQPGGHTGKLVKGSTVLKRGPNVAAAAAASATSAPLKPKRAPSTQKKQQKAQPPQPLPPGPQFCIEPTKSSGPR